MPSKGRKTQSELAMPGEATDPPTGTQTSMARQTRQTCSTRATSTQQHPTPPTLADKTTALTHSPSVPAATPTTTLGGQLAKPS